MSDVFTFGLTVLAFAVAATAHVAIVYGLAWRPPRTRALIALVIFPLAAYWALREKMRVRAGAWILGVATYITARLIQRG